MATRLVLSPWQCKWAKNASPYSSISVYIRAKHQDSSLHGNIAVAVQTVDRDIALSIVVTLPTGGKSFHCPLTPLSTLLQQLFQPE